jgi:catechol 2,3-dioxygenase-like lactoylglutathione lyase family enzyme
MRRIATVTLLVPDYEAGIAFFVGRLGFALLSDAPVGGGKRWVVVGPADGGCRLLLARTADAAQRAAIGRQAGGRVFLFLETDDFARDHAAMIAAGVEFLEPPRREAYGLVAQWRDPFGGLWDLIQPFP